jgi:hypothetical protein
MHSPEAGRFDRCLHLSWRMNEGAEVIVRGSPPEVLEADSELHVRSTIRDAES